MRPKKQNKIIVQPTANFPTSQSEYYQKITNRHSIQEQPFLQQAPYQSRYHGQQYQYKEDRGSANYIYQEQQFYQRVQPQQQCFNDLKPILQRRMSEQDSGQEEDDTEKEIIIYPQQRTQSLERRKDEILERNKRKQIKNYEKKIRIQIQERNASKIDYLCAPPNPIEEEFIRKNPHEYFQKFAPPMFGQIIPLPQQGQKYESVDRMLNNHFYILREDYLRDFRQAIFELQKIKKEDKNIIFDRNTLKDLFFYFDLNLEQFELRTTTVVFTVTMEAYDQRGRAINWKFTNRLKPGSLLAITDEDLDKFIFATVVDKPDLNNSTKSVAYVKITLLEESIQKQIETFNNILMTNKQIYIFENKAFYETYIHYLRCLQNMDPSSLPFQSYIVNASTYLQAPKYLQMVRQGNQPIYYNVNLQFDLHASKQYSYDRTMQVNVFSDNWPSQIQQSLDDSQLKAVQLILKSEISLIQGPPGTGKTFCGALGVRILQENQSRWNPMNRAYVNHPILIVCYTNHALDQFLNHIMTFTNKKDILRIGGRCKDENLQECLLQNLQKQVKINFNFNLFYNLLESIENKLQDLINIKDSVDFYDVNQYWPKLVNLIVIEYLQKEDKIFQNEISQSSKRYIIHMWLDCAKPRDKDANEIIRIEKNEYSNQLVNQPAQKEKKFKAALKLINQNYNNIPINISMEQQIRLLENFYNGVDENNRLDSDEEEDRKQFLSNYYEQTYGRINCQQNFKKVLKKLGFDKIKLELIEQKLERGESLWDFSQVERQTIEKKIFQFKYIDNSNNYQNELQQFQDMQKLLKSLYLQKDIQLMQQKKIIGVTVNGCAKYAEKLDQLQYKILVIEEAAEVLEAHIVSILNKNVEHLIMIGDHQQLKPKLESYYLETRYRTDVSLFERLVLNELPYVTLQCQRRMKSNFADFIRLIYGNSYRDHVTIQIKTLQKLEE